MNGSFVTAKDEPGDFDACWDTDYVGLDALNPLLPDLSNHPMRTRLRELRTVQRWSQSDLVELLGVSRSESMVRLHRRPTTQHTGNTSEATVSS